MYESTEKDYSDAGDLSESETEEHGAAETVVPADKRAKRKSTADQTKRCSGKKRPQIRKKKDAEILEFRDKIREQFKAALDHHVRNDDSVLVRFNFDSEKQLVEPHNLRKFLSAKTDAEKHLLQEYSSCLLMEDKVRCVWEKNHNTYAATVLTVYPKTALERARAAAVNPNELVAETAVAAKAKRKARPPKADLNKKQLKSTGIPVRANRSVRFQSAALSIGLDNIQHGNMYPPPSANMSSLLSASIEIPNSLQKKDPQQSLRPKPAALANPKSATPAAFEEPLGIPVRAKDAIFSGRSGPVIGEATYVSSYRQGTYRTEGQMAATNEIGPASQHLTVQRQPTAPMLYTPRFSATGGTNLPTENVPSLTLRPDSVLCSTGIPEYANTLSLTPLQPTCYSTQPMGTNDVLQDISRSPPQGVGAGSCTEHFGPVPTAGSSTSNVFLEFQKDQLPYVPVSMPPADSSGHMSASFEVPNDYFSNCFSTAESSGYDSFTGTPGRHIGAGNDFFVTEIQPTLPFDNEGTSSPARQPLASHGIPATEHTASAHKERTKDPDEELRLYAVAKEPLGIVPADCLKLYDETGRWFFSVHSTSKRLLHRDVPDIWMETAQLEFLEQNASTDKMYKWFLFIQLLGGERGLDRLFSLWKLNGKKQFQVILGFSFMKALTSHIKEAMESWQGRGKSTTQQTLNSLLVDRFSSWRSKNKHRLQRLPTPPTS